MDDFVVGALLLLCDVLAKSLNLGICVLAIVELFLTSYCGKSLSGLKRTILDLNGESKNGRRTVVKPGKGKVTTIYEITVEKDWTKFDAFRKDYQSGLAKYNTFSLIIQLFPLLGILGTVAGLYIAMNVHDGTESLYEGVGVALSSTVLGIFFAIIYKCVDVVLSNMVNTIDDNIDRYKRNYDLENQEAQGTPPGIKAAPTKATCPPERREQ